MRKLSIVLGVIVLALVVGGAGLYVSRNPERETLNDATRKEAPGRFVRLADGITHYDLSGPDSGRVVVLVHGFSVPYYIWDSTATALSSAGYRVLRYDEYGRGWSDRPDIPYGADLYDRQLVQLLDSLHITDRIDLAGLSMGGWVTGTFATRHPARLRSLTLVDPVAGKSGTFPGFLSWPLIGDFVWQTTTAPNMAGGQLSDFVAPQRFPDWPERYRVQMRFRGFARALIATRRATSEADMDTLYASVAKTKVPVLLIWGKEDATVPFERSAGVRAAIPSAEFHAIDGVGHLPILERAAHTDSIIAAFLGKQPR